MTHGHAAGHVLCGFVGSKEQIAEEAGESATAAAKRFPIGCSSAYR